METEGVDDKIKVIEANEEVLYFCSSVSSTFRWSGTIHIQFGSEID